jgi:hypothetical protein
VFVVLAVVRCHQWVVAVVTHCDGGSVGGGGGATAVVVLVGSLLLLLWWCK